MWLMTQIGLNLLEMLLQANMTYMLETTNILLCYTGMVSNHMILMMLWMFL